MVIGTEFVSSRFRTGEGRQRWEVTMNNPTPLRGMFTGTTQGYLEFAMASAENRELLGRPVRMASAGEAFQQWQAWIPWFNSVEMVPSASYDALILVQRLARRLCPACVKTDLPPPIMLEMGKKHGVPVAALVGAKEHAVAQVRAGTDILVVAGGEAGGHCGDVSTMVLIPEVHRAVKAMGKDTPILAAGGITTGLLMPSTLCRGSNLPLPQELSAAFVAASIAGDSAMIAGRDGFAMIAYRQDVTTTDALRLANERRPLELRWAGDIRGNDLARMQALAKEKKQTEEFVLASLALSTLRIEKYEVGHAEESTHDALRRDSQNPDAKALMARIKLEQGNDVTEASELIDETLKTNPIHPAALAIKAEILIDNEQYEDALAILDPAIARNGYDLPARALRAAALLDRKSVV